ncbi:TPA: 50S ribosomal protein L10 [Candidatus Woesearchaeota archaeon]|nr:50S ribosomal protein L10 [Candidatus Woesearchaeota archaeon]HIH31075.1 50S ribosomal protein L10 [Candidatus Woesearchaeota archaeon]HIJ01540.1 50S ribosomal protein L10 [Candidatus Woesearchaeota archaeon]HIJ13844.1 50S ribosomal protein L10 [Candidatus Woesearchaeota archaeon]
MKSTIRKASHIPESKLKAVEQLSALIDSYPIVAILNLENLPAKQLQQMKGKLRKECEIRMAKKPLITQALKKSAKKDIANLTEYLSGMPALLLTKENPFKIFKTIKKSKSSAAIKAGQITPRDIMLPAGPTPFAPGPIIGELGMLKIKAGIEAGKVIIKEDVHVAKKGDVIKPQLSSLLLRLGIEPMEIGLDLVAIYENGEILTKDVLDIDQDAFMLKLQTAASEALNLAVDIAYPSNDTIELLIAKAFNDSKCIAVERDILADLVIDKIIAKADAQAASVKKAANLD